MEYLKEYFHRMWMRHYFWFILVVVIQFSLLIIHYSQAPPEPDRKCPEDQAKLDRTVSQLEAENLSLKKQLAMTEKEKRRIKKVADQTLEKTLQLLEKWKEEADGLSKQLSVSNRSLVETRRLLQKAKVEIQGLQSQLEIAKEDLRKTQEQRDSWQNQLAEFAPLKTQLAMVEKAKDQMEYATNQNLENEGIKWPHTLEEKLKSPDSETKEIQKSHANGRPSTDHSCDAGWPQDADEITQLQLKIQQTEKLQDFIRNERDRCWSRVSELQNQISYQQKKCSIQAILDDGSILSWAFGILVLFLCCVKCCRPES